MLRKLPAPEDLELEKYEVCDIKFSEGDDPVYELRGKHNKITVKQPKGTFEIGEVVMLAVCAGNCKGTYKYSFNTLTEKFERINKK